MSLSARLRSDTSEAHRAAEGTLIVRQILTGTLGLPDYCRMLLNLHAIYQELERQLLRHAANPSIQQIGDQRLARAPALEEDLKHLIGEGWSEAVQFEFATRAYLERLASIGESDPARLVAHAYVRYLGDMSGGQVISRAVRPILGTAADQALHFYDFGSKADVAELKAKFRDGLDRIEGKADEIVEEALIAFDGARNLFEELSSTISGAATESQEHIATAHAARGSAADR